MSVLFIRVDAPACKELVVFVVVVTVVVNVINIIIIIIIDNVSYLDGTKERSACFDER